MWQLPPNFRRDDERLAGRAAALPPGRHCFEFRHESWFVPEVEELLRAHGVALVIGDQPERPFQTHTFTADWTLVRFHYGRRGRNGNYSEDGARGVGRAHRPVARPSEVFAYFNNDWEGLAIRNAGRCGVLSRVRDDPLGHDPPRRPPRHAARGRVPAVAAGQGAVHAAAARRGRRRP